MISFKFLSSKATSISLTPEQLDSDNLELEFDVEFDRENRQIFVINFNAVISSTHGYRLVVEYLAFFEAEEPINEEFKTSPLITVNAPAIAYPFLRSFISTLTLNAGYLPVLLPVLNFKEIVQEKELQKQSNQTENNCSVE